MHDELIRDKDEEERKSWDRSEEGQSSKRSSPLPFPDMGALYCGDASSFKVPVCGHFGCTTSHDANQTYASVPNAELETNSPAKNSSQASTFFLKGAAIEEAISTWIGVFFLLTPTVDNAFGLKADTPLGALPTTVALSVLATFIAYSTAYCHYQLNKNSQTDHARCNHDHADGLSLGNILHLFGDGLGHAAEFSGFANGVLSISAANYLNRWEMLCLNAALFMAGVILAIPDMRTCAKHVQGHIHADDQQTGWEAEKAMYPDRWTWAGLGGFTLRTSFALLIFLGETLDTARGLSADTPLGLSKSSVFYAGLAALVLTAGAAYCDAMVNTNHQAPALATYRPPVGTTLQCYQSAALACGSIALSSGFAASVALVVNVASHDSLKTMPCLALSAGLFAVGVPLTWANIDTFRTHLKVRNEVFVDKDPLTVRLLSDSSDSATNSA